MKTSETWIQHPIHKTYYFSNLGNVERRQNGKIKKLIGCSAGAGYRYVAYEDKTREYIHRAVCTLFNGIPTEDKPQCRHLDGNKTNNSAANLKWGTALENQHDREIHGTKCYGAKNPMAKLSSEIVSRMKLAKADTKQSFKNIGAMFGVSTMTAFRAITERSWK